MTGPGAPTAITAEMVGLLARGAVDRALADAQAAHAEVLRALGVTLDEDEQALVGMALAAGAMAGIDAMAAIQHAAGGAALPPALPAWVEQATAMIQKMD